MKNRKYKVCRDDICVGKVVDISKSKIGFNNNKIIVENGSYLRSILYVRIKNEIEIADDLLYTETNYPILDSVYNDSYLKLIKGRNIVVVDSYNISKLLKIFDYNEELTYKDIFDIRKIFFSGRFGREHCALFGYLPISKNIDDGFIYTNRGILSKEYLDVLDNMGNNSFVDVITNKVKRDTFKPLKEEGFVKKLTRF